MAELEDIPPTAYPDGSVIGNFDAGTNPPESPELLHRPHAFALMHGDDGAKVAYGELHWRVDVLRFKFETSTIAVNAHPDHAHDHPHTHTTTSQSTTKSGPDLESTGGSYGGGSGYDTSTADHYHDITHDHTISQPVSTDTTSGVKETDGSSSSGLTHTVTGQITYCAQTGQESIGKINQQVPKVDAEDGDSMDATIPNIYHQLSSYGDVYLCWKADLEQGAGSEITHCWVQIGEPANDDIDELTLGNSTTNRRSASGSDGITGANDNGIYSIKLGTVNVGGQITQKVSSDVVWSPTVMDRIGP